MPDRYLSLLLMGIKEIKNGKAGAPSKWWGRLVFLACIPKSPVANTTLLLSCTFFVTKRIWHSGHYRRRVASWSKDIDLVPSWRFTKTWLSSCQDIGRLSWSVNFILWMTWCSEQLFLCRAFSSICIPWVRLNCPELWGLLPWWLVFKLFPCLECLSKNCTLATTNGEKLRSLREVGYVSEADSWWALNSKEAGTVVRVSVKQAHGIICRDGILRS